MEIFIMSNSKNNSTPVDAPIEIVVADIGGTNARFAIARYKMDRSLPLTAKPF